MRMDAIPSNDDDDDAGEDVSAMSVSMVDVDGWQIIVTFCFRII